MKGTYHGPLSVDDFFQALFQDREFFRRYNITHIRKASVHFTPADEHGQPVLVLDKLGNRIDGYVSAGAYRSAAAAYERAMEKDREFETRPVVNQESPASLPFSPL